MTTAPSDRALPPLVRHGVLAALAASVLTLAIFLAATLAGAPLNVPGPNGERMAVGAPLVVLASVASAFGATLVVAALNTFTRHPRRSFEVTALVVLALSLMPMLAGNLPTATVVALGGMHLVVAAAIVAFLRPAARPAR